MPTAEQRKGGVMSTTQRLLRFGAYELNLDTEELRKLGTIIKLPPQSLKLLAILASRAGQQVSREEIQKQLWWDTLIDFKQGINRCINQIRNVLGDNANHPLYIETVPRKGYRFVAPVTSKNILAPRPQIVEWDSGERDRTSARLASAGGTSAALAEAAARSHAPEPEVIPLPGPAPVPEPRSRFRRRVLVGIGVVVIVAVAIGAIYWRAHRARALTEKDTIVIADFDKAKTAYQDFLTLWKDADAAIPI
jgi:DNA-binding winged helix-turn-helix (wHTH) protein